MPAQPVPLITLIERNSNDIDEIYELIKAVNAHLSDHDARFDSVDARLDSVDARFDSVDARLEVHGTQLTEILAILKR